MLKKLKLFFIVGSFIIAGSVLLSGCSQSRNNEEIVPVEENTQNESDSSSDSTQQNNPSEDVNSSNSNDIAEEELLEDYTYIEDENDNNSYQDASIEEQQRQEEANQATEKCVSFINNVVGDDTGLIGTEYVLQDFENACGRSISYREDSNTNFNGTVKYYYFVDPRFPGYYMALVGLNHISGTMPEEFPYVQYEDTNGHVLGLYDGALWDGNQIIIRKQR
jgi:hypothetical protein